MKTVKSIRISLLVTASFLFACNHIWAQSKQAESELDKRVNDFLKQAVEHVAGYERACIRRKIVV